jgi:hypothetical protein
MEQKTWLTTEPNEEELTTVTGGLDELPGYHSNVSSSRYQASDSSSRWHGFDVGSTHSSTPEPPPTTRVSALTHPVSQAFAAGASAVLFIKGLQYGIDKAVNH